MKKRSAQKIFKALNEDGVQFLVAGGLAVNVHGSLRFTADIDIVVRLLPENIHKTFAAFRRIGYRPIVPVTAASFADEPTRKGWIRDKGMRVLQFYSEEHLETPVDIFVEEPFSFDEEYGRALVKPLADGTPVPFVSLSTLLQMKKSAGRPQDLADIDDLQRGTEEHG
ncbi:MAG: nucleotidyl transferase AbiEii/AbiGii toxin family protein [Armatimonadetes bacterium]|nr:nucleotidyl transferase AbiEii/AbiGii toxin family protein [Armatimonadota bacterium]